jgi:hypothetical protein
MSVLLPLALDRNASIEVEKPRDQKKYCIHPSRDFLEALLARLGLGFSFSGAYIANG